jgi:DNA-directed RNA polymerase specialized sigma24 family protein
VVVFACTTGIRSVFRKAPIPMSRERVLLREEFEALLAWLDKDRERAALRYEQIRSRLIQVFVCRGSSGAEELADETIDRVMGKVAQISGTYLGDPALYFYGVAKNVFHESVRAKPISPPSPKAIEAEEESHEHDCLEKCMQQLPPETRRLILAYHEKSGQAKIDAHRQLAEELGLGVNALRIRVHRIRARVRECMVECMRARHVQPT